MRVYHVEKRIESGNPTSPSNGQPFFVVTGPGCGPDDVPGNGPYLSVDGPEHAAYLANCMNIAYAQGRSASCPAGSIVY